jgi:hypothetical protein
VRLVLLIDAGEEEEGKIQIQMASFLSFSFWQMSEGEREKKRERSHIVLSIH